MSYLHASINEMMKIWQSMRVAWDVTHQSWKDKDRDKFEREYINELSQVTEAYIAKLCQLAEALQQIRNATP